MWDTCRSGAALHASGCPIQPLSHPIPYTSHRSTHHTQDAPDVCRVFIKVEESRMLQYNVLTHATATGMEPSVQGQVILCNPMGKGERVTVFFEGWVWYACSWVWYVF